LGKTSGVVGENLGKTLGKTFLKRSNRKPYN
jgi:hypothetical protein